MALSLSQAVHDTEDVAAGLQIFEDNVPEDPEIHLDIKGLTALSQSLRNLGTLYDSRFNSRLNQDVDILLRSLQHTLRRVRAMFSETRWIRNGQRLYRLAWQDMCYEMTNSEHGQNLNARLGIYQLFVNDMTEALERFVLSSLILWLDTNFPQETAPPGRDEPSPVLDCVATEQAGAY